MSLAVVTLKKGEGRFLKSGGLWVYDNEIASIMGSFNNGDIVLVHDFDGYPMGRGFINTNSRIAIRMLTRDEHTEITEEFLRQRVRDAWDYRRKVVDTGSCRIIFGEADFLPGLVIDKFSDVLVVQSLALGIDKFKEKIVDILKDILENAIANKKKKILDKQITELKEYKHYADVMDTFDDIKNKAPAFSLPVKVGTSS